MPNQLIRKALYTLVIGLSSLVLTFFLLIKPQQVNHKLNYKNNPNIRAEAQKGAENNTDMNVSRTSTKLISTTKIEDEKIEQELDEHKEYQVFGYETLEFIAHKYNVPTSVIVKDLNMPISSSTEKLGQLRKQYNFTMKDIRRSIYNYRRDEKCN